MTDKFIGRGESRAAEILRVLFPRSSIWTQTPISQIVSAASFRELGEEYRKHKFDIFVINKNQDMAIELNYKHGSKAYQKWHNVYEPHLKAVYCRPVVIEESECESLFELDEETKTHTNTWQDYIDVIKALDKAGVMPQ